ncbi:MAG: hypothetical protein ABI706_12415 [Ilumatobacteraceae bacterium]
MKGYLLCKGNQHYAVTYEVLDPVTGCERRRWRPAGADRPMRKRSPPSLPV